MPGRRTIPLLVLIMAAVTVSAAGIAILVLYSAACDTQRTRLREIVRSRARLIEAIARDNLEYHTEHPDSDVLGDTVALLREAHQQFEGFGDTGEFTLAACVDDQIVFLLGHRHGDLGDPKPVPLAATVAEPMRRALSGESGTVIGPDYRGATVLAAHEPVAELNLGVVAKIDLAEIRAPFVEAALLAGGAGFVLIVIGTVLFQRIGTPLVRRLAESELKYRTLFASGTEGVFLASDQAVFEDCNEQACRLWACTRRDIIGHSPFEFSPPNQPDGRASTTALRERIDEALAGTPQFYPWQHRRKDGVVIDMDVSLRSVVISGRRKILVAMYDTTQRMQAERALRASEQRAREQLAELDHLYSTAPVGLCLYDADLRYVRINERLAAINGRSIAEHIGKTVREILPGLPVVEQRLRRVVDTGQPEIDVEICGTTAADPGVQRTWLTSYRPIESEDGAVRGITTAVLEITERKRAEDERARLSLAVEQAFEDILITDPDGTIRYVNPAFERISGYTREEVVGENPRMLKSGQHDEDFYGELWETIGRGEAWTGRFINKRKDGTLYELEGTISPIFDASGTIAGHVSVRRDVTQERALESQLLQSQKMEAVGQLAGGVAHDFNNILTAILGNAEVLAMLLRSESRDERQLLARLDEINRAAQKAASLTRQLLAFSRRQIVQPEVLDLHAVVGGIEKMITRLIGEHISLRRVPAGKPCRVRADAGQIEQVILNLAVNARDAMPDGGRLSIETANVELDEAFCAGHPSVSPGRYVMLAVSDTGCGMGRQTLARVFEPFFTTKPIGRGTGLGLSTAYGIIQQAGGVIDVESQPDQGSTFRIYLPAIDAPPEDEPASAATDEIRGGHETVLLCEDDETVRALARSVLEGVGYNVLSAETGARAMKHATTHQGPIDLLITDVILPDTNGKKVAEQFHAVFPTMKVLFMSGYTSDLIAHHGVLDEGLEFLEKPFNIGELRRRVRKVLDRA